MTVVEWLWRDQCAFEWNHLRNHPCVHVPYNCRLAEQNLVLTWKPMCFHFPDFGDADDIWTFPPVLPIPVLFADAIADPNPKQRYFRCMCFAYTHNFCSHACQPPQIHLKIKFSFRKSFLANKQPKKFNYPFYQNALTDNWTLICDKNKPQVAGDIELSRNDSSSWNVSARLERESVSQNSIRFPPQKSCISVCLPDEHFQTSRGNFPTNAFPRGFYFIHLALCERQSWIYLFSNNLIRSDSNFLHRIIILMRWKVWLTYSPRHFTDLYSHCFDSLYFRRLCPTGCQLFIP